MTNLRFETMSIESADLGGLSDFPSMYKELNLQSQREIALNEDDELFVDIGKVPLMLPYRQRSLYNREFKEKKVNICILENDALKAVFLPDYGGRLWSLFDKKGNRELLYRNDCLKFGNLALRNAWFSGGVEWNVGLIGHTPLTCETLHTAQLTDDSGNPVLRFYAFERIREIVYQMDFSLPEGSNALLARIRIRNPHHKTIPMYWWSNMALPENKGARVVVPANSSFMSADKGIGYTSLPFDENGVDISYPTNTMDSKDYFYRINPRKRKYIAYFQPDGSGFFQTSTFRQKGRKLFVWGQGAGSDTWQHWLNYKDDRYVELQAGLGQTQYECIPMPPLAAWEWTEAYGALQAEPSSVFGDWEKAQNETLRQIESVIGEEELEQYLEKSKESVALKKGKTVIFGDGWAALEQMRRKLDNEQPLEPHLDFGTLQDEQSDWLYLLKHGKFPKKDVKDTPQSYCVSKVWEQKVNNIPVADRNWYTYYQMGVIAMSKTDWQVALQYFAKSIELENNGWAHYGLAVVFCYLDDKEKCIYHAKQSINLCGGRVSVIRDAGKLLLHFNAYKELLSVIEPYVLNEEIAKDGRIGFYRVKSLVELNCIAKAEEILYSDGGLIIPDIREGELSITQLWFDIERKKAELRGEAFDVKKLKPPAQFDFRLKHTN